MSKKMKIIYQSESAECALTCLTMILNYHEKNYSLRELRDKYYTSQEGMSFFEITNIAKQEDLIPMAYHVEAEDLDEINTPCIAHWKGEHFVVIKKITKNHVEILNPNPASGELKLTKKDFLKAFSNKVCEFKKGENFTKIKNETEEENKSFFKFIKNIEGLPKSILRIFTMALFVEMFLMVIPLFNKIAVDQIIMEGDHNILFSIGLGFTFVVLFQIIAEWFRNNMIMKLSVDLQMTFKYNLFYKLLNLPLEYYMKRGTSNILSRFSSLEDIRDKISNGIIEGIISGIAILVTGFLMFYLSNILFFIVSSFILINFLIRFSAIGKIRDLTKQIINTQAAEEGILIETLKTVESTKGHGEEEKIFKKWYLLHINFMTKFIDFSKFNINLNIVEKFMSNIEKIIIVWVGTALVIEEKISMGVLFAFISYQLIFSEQVKMLIKNIFEFKLLGLHFDRINDIKLTKEEEYKFGKISPDYFNENIKGEIEIKNLYFKYAGKEEYLFENLNLKIKAGESVVFTGESGCGKTTLMKIIAGLIQPEKGDIIIDGMNIKDIGLDNYRKKIGLLLQNENQLYSGTIEDNITLFDEKFLLEDVQEATKKACIHEDIINLKMRYKTILGDLGNMFSGGQEQRLILARTLYRKPKILFIDEGTSALDLDLEKRIIENLKKEKMTRISIAHREESKKLADRIIDVTELIKK